MLWRSKCRYVNSIICHCSSFKLVKCHLESIALSVINFDEISLAPTLHNFLSCPETPESSDSYCSLHKSCNWFEFFWYSQVCLINKAPKHCTVCQCLQRSAESNWRFGSDNYRAFILRYPQCKCFHCNSINNVGFRRLAFSKIQKLHD